MVSTAAFYETLGFRMGKPEPEYPRVLWQLVLGRLDRDGQRRQRGNHVCVLLQYSALDQDRQWDLAHGLT